MKKIMFNDKYGLTDAVLQDRKKMTRRLFPPMPDFWVNGVLQTCEQLRIDDDVVKGYIEGLGWLTLPRRNQPYYKSGEIVAVSQRYAELNAQCLLPDDAKHTLANSAGWRNKQSVKANLMPHLILITDVRVERLQDISEEDCMREGILKKSDFPYKKTSPFYFAGGKHEWDNSFHTPRQAYAALIDKISGKGTWKSNPYVFVYEFELIK